MPSPNKELFDALVAKAGLKQEVYTKTLNAFNQFKNEVIRLANDYPKKIKQTQWPIPF
jgi:hypothetical protein